MKQKISKVLKISFTLLYLLITTPGVLSMTEKDLGQPFLDIYYQRIDANVNKYMVSGYMPQSYFAKTLNFMQQSQGIHENMLTVEKKYLEEVNNIKRSLKQDETPPKEKSDRIHFLSHLANTIGWWENELRYVIPNLRVTPRYNNVDSYIWNSISMDFVQNFEDPDQLVDTNLATRFFYPSSKIEMPTWKNLGESMNLSMIPMPQSTYEFIAVSAPVHNDLTVPDSMLIPKKIILNNRLSDDLNGLNPNQNDMNMIYFFRMMVTQNVHMVIAICSDPEVDPSSPDDQFKFIFDDQLRVLNKCHLYWRVEFEMTFNNQKYLISSEEMTSLKTDLYKVYQLSIKSATSSFEHQTKVFVLSEWPDHQELPENMVPSQMILYDIMFRHLSPLDNQPLERVMIHCSAGVGRTGTTILGYQMYVHLRMVAALDLMNETTNFQTFIQNYIPTNLSTSLVSETNKNLAQYQEFKNESAKVEIFQKSRLVAYLMDSLIYYRMRRMWFVQTVDQFEFLIKFAWMLNIKIIKSHISPKGKVITNDNSLDIPMEHMANIYNPMYRENKMKLVHKEDESSKLSTLKQSPRPSNTSSPKSVKDKKSVSKVMSSEVTKESSKIDNNETSSQIESKSNKKNEKLDVGGITISKDKLEKLKSKLSAQSSHKDDEKHMLI